MSEVLKGMVLGDDQAVDQQSISDFRRSGLLHILAVSGENVVLLCGMWSFALMLLAVPRLARTDAAPAGRRHLRRAHRRVALHRARRASPA